MGRSRGSIRGRSPGSWQLRLYRGVDPDTGKPCYATRTVRGSRRAAETALVELVAEVDHARVHAGTVAELLERWFRVASPGWALSTVGYTRSVIDGYLLPRLGGVAVVELTTADIDELYGVLLARGGRRGRGLAAGTVRRVHQVLHRALVQAVWWGWIFINPAASASPPRVRRTELCPPTPGQVVTLLESVRESDPSLFVLLRLAATTGARRGQLLALRWTDIDLDRGTISFVRSLVIGPDGPTLAPTKTDRTHQVDLDAETLHILRQHKRRAQARARRAGLELASIHRSPPRVGGVGGWSGSSADR